MSEICNHGIEKTARAVRQDESLPVLRGLIARGYDKAIWNVNEGDTHVYDICDIYNGNVFDLVKLTSNLQYRASIFETSHVNCFHKDTEVYTNQGFKKFSDLNKSELVATINPNSQEFQWQLPTNYIAHKYTGELYCFDSVHISTATTPEHRYYLEMRRGDGLTHQIGNRKKKWERYRFIQAKNLINKQNKPSHSYRLPLTSAYYGGNDNSVTIGDLTFTAKEFCMFMGYYLSEGNTVYNNKGYRIRIIQLKEKSFKNIEKVLHDIFDKYKIKIEIIKEKKRGVRGFRFYHKELSKYLSQFGKSPMRYIPEEIKNYNKELINLFLEKYIEGDGHVTEKNERWIFTSSKKLSEDFIELALKSGSAVSLLKYKEKGEEFISPYDNSIKKLNYDHWKINLKNSINANFRSMKFSKMDYDDYVYCLSLPNETMLIRYNGKISWTGNCLCQLLCFSTKDRDLPYVLVDWRGDYGEMGHVTDNSKSRERAKDFNNLYTRYRTIFDEIRNNKFLTGNQSDPDNGIYSFDVTVYGDYGYNQNVKNQLGNQILEIILNNATKYKIKVDNSSLIGNDYIIYTDNDMTFYDFTREDLINLTWNIKQRRDELNGVINDLNNLENFLIFTQEEINKLLVQYDNGD